jgi:hypothetical protein
MIPFCQFASLLLVGLAPKPLQSQINFARFCFTKHLRKEIVKNRLSSKGVRVLPTSGAKLRTAVRPISEQSERVVVSLSLAKVQNCYWVNLVSARKIEKN